MRAFIPHPVMRVIANVYVLVGVIALLTRSRG